MENYALKLLHKFRDKKFKQIIKQSKKSTRECLYGFKAYLNKLSSAIVKTDNSANEPYIIGAVFKNNKSIPKGVELNNFMKVSLTLANRKFNDLVSIIESDDPKMKHGTIVKFGDLIREFIMDVKPFVEYFERKTNKDFVLFQGWKSYNNYSYELILISNNLYWNGFYKQNIFDQKMATNIATFSLRQALEIKFKRVCGIYDVYNTRFDGPKLRHDFFPDFINNNKDLLHLPNMQLADIIKVYKWTNLTIHNAENPRIWELRFALDYVAPFFKWVEHSDETGNYIKSVNGAIIIKDYENLKERLITAFNNISDDILCIEFIQPEAIILK